MKRTIFGKDFPLTFKNLKPLDLEGRFTGEEIEIDSSLEGDDSLQTEIHEFFHAVNERLGFIQTSISEDLWEIIIDNYARALIENYEVKPKN